MPELPEVETIRRDLAGRALGRRISAVHILSPKTASHAAAFFKTVLVGRRLISLERRGKLLILGLSPLLPKSKLSPAARISHLLIHLKMTGQLIYLDRRNKIAGGHSLGGHSFASAVGGELPNKYTRASLEFVGGGKLFFNDLRKFGYWKLVSAPELAKILAAGYGPEPLSREFSLTFLTALLKNRKTKIKPLLLDQKAIAGLGNIYVDEVLWAARLRPDRAAGSLQAVEIKRLHQAIKRLIKLAIKHRGTTFSDYVDAQGRKGNFSRLLKVYGRRGESCPNCRKPIIRTKIAGRGTHYCPRCQK
ncbi:MAG: bifunctional DNA-formamidopyrimidine glycosylase/DNA-(apurinic or apyrimidinic site) lyase [Patescibacteria group bacterium]